MTHTKLTSIAVALACLAAQPAGAMTGAQNARAITVSYGDLNLRREDAVEALLGRIEAAAKRVCGPAPDFQDRRALTGYENCVKESMDRAVADIRVPLVAEIYGRTDIAYR